MKMSVASFGFGFKSSVQRALNSIFCTQTDRVTIITDSSVFHPAPYPASIIQAKEIGRFKNLRRGPSEIDSLLPAGDCNLYAVLI